jgi:hypothetical protein
MVSWTSIYGGPRKSQFKDAIGYANNCGGKLILIGSYEVYE